MNRRWIPYLVLGALGLALLMALGMAFYGQDESHPGRDDGGDGTQAQPDGKQQEWIRCPKCGRVSWNANDVREGYCGYCHDWTTPRP